MSGDRRGPNPKTYDLEADRTEMPNLAGAGPEGPSYDPSWSSGLEDYGRTWMYFPDGDGVPRVALLNSDERSTPSVPDEVGPDDVTFYLYTR